MNEGTNKLNKDTCLLVTFAGIQYSLQNSPAQGNQLERNAEKHCVGWDQMSMRHNRNLNFILIYYSTQLTSKLSDHAQVYT